MCGCITEEMPAAKKGIISLPAPCSPVAARYASGGIWPYTTETFTPAFSKTSPPCRTREMPPPPPGRVHASSWNFWPSSSSIAPQISFCAARIIFSKRARMESGVVAAALAQERERGFVEGDFFFDRARGRRGRADGDLF